MQITLDLLRANGACEDGVNAFLGQYPDGLADYQDVLNKCVEHDLERYAAWLLNAVGPTMDVLRIEGDLITDKSIYICGSLYVTGSINAGGGINAGWGVNAGESIKVGWGVNAGGGINAGRGIKAGESINAGRGINAGGGIKAGENINAGRGIKAGESIKAGWGVNAGENINAGRNYGIYAGLHARLDDIAHRSIRAAHKPERIMTGVWVDD